MDILTDNVWQYAAQRLGVGKKLNPGYTTLFYGLPGTGITIKASENEKKGKSPIATQISMAEKIKNDPNLVVNRKELIEIFDKGKTVKEMKVTRKTNREKK